ncbi:MAG TPA: relaxase/mobilization nuclease domain-containing protein [Sphingobacteriaceae bacterium]
MRSGKSIRGILHYNEHKVQSGTAQLILASRFISDIEKLSFQNKLYRFENITSLNERVKTNALHISLNFDPSEKLSQEQLQNIASTYMDKIGFGEQPFLVYRHTDAAHPHIHIATINIKADGERIDIHNIGRNESEQARKEIEEEFNLIKASTRNKQEEPLKPINLGKVVYGKSETKRAITNTVNEIVRSYRFTSVAELNAILQQFNVIADRGSEVSRMYENHGLIYSLLNNGNKMGVPIKASTIYGKPTLKNLEPKFEQNKEKRKPYRIPLRMAIDKTMSKQALTKDTFKRLLKNESIDVIFRQNDQGITYGLTFIDHRNKTVFNGSDLGKAYSAKAITERFIKEDKHPDKLVPTNPKPEVMAPKPDLLSKDSNNLLETLLSKPEYDGSPLLPRKKKKRRRGFRM